VRKRRLYWQSLPMKIVSTAVLMFRRPREKCERPLVGMENHLLPLVRIGAHHIMWLLQKRICTPSRSPRPVQHDGQRSPSRSRSTSPRPGDGVIAAFVAVRPRLLEKAGSRSVAGGPALRHLSPTAHRVLPFSSKLRAQPREAAFWRRCADRFSSRIHGASARVLERFLALIPALPRLNAGAPARRRRVGRALHFRFHL
jgi:hypothetical protein